MQAISTIIQIQRKQLKTTSSLLSSSNYSMRFASPTLLLVYTAATAQAFSSTGIRTASRSVATTTQLAAEKKRVVVTGLGVISGCGIGHKDFFQNVSDGKSSLGKITRFDVTHFPCQIGSEVPDDMFDPKDHFTNPKNAKSNDRFTHFAVAASRLALKDAGIGDTPETLVNPDKCGAFIGTAFGGMETFENEVLKLWKKPERPKVCHTIVREVNYTLFFVASFAKQPSSLRIRSMLINQSFSSLLLCQIVGLSLHYSCSPS
jgi:hypothetical protein